MRCIEPIFNLVVKDCRKLVCNGILNLQAVIIFILGSVKLCHLYEKVQELNSLHGLHVLDFDIRWSSTFTLVNLGSEARRFINAVVVYGDELSIYVIIGAE